MRNAAAIAVATVALACAGGARSVRPGGAEAAPDWVSRGTGAFQLEAGKQLQAVGSAPPSDPKTRRQQADAAAEQQMAQGIDALAAAMARLSESGGSQEGPAGLTRKAAALAAAIRDHWVSSDGTEQAVEVLDLASFKEALQKADGDERLKRELSANAERAFDSLLRQ